MQFTSSNRRLQNKLLVFLHFPHQISPAQKCGSTNTRLVSFQKKRSLEPCCESAASRRHRHWLPQLTDVALSRLVLAHFHFESQLTGKQTIGIVNVG